MSNDPTETKLTPTHYYEITGDGNFEITPFSPEDIPEGEHPEGEQPEGEQFNFIHVVSDDPKNPLITHVDKDGNVLAEKIMPDGLQEAVKAVLNPTTGGRRRRSRRQSRRQSKRRSKRQNGGRRRRNSKRNQRR